MDIHATFWDIAKLYFTYIKFLLWLITVPNMNKINPFFFCDITTIIKFKKNIGIITQIWHRAKWYFTCVSNTWYLITVPNMNTSNPFFFEISQQIHKCMKRCHNYSNVAQSQMLFYKHEQGMVLANWTKYEQNHHIHLRNITTSTQNLWKNSYNYTVN